MTPQNSITAPVCSMSHQARPASGKRETVAIGNLLIQGDNIAAMEDLISAHGLMGSIDLVYIDPPFATNDIFSVSAGRASTISRAKG